MRKKYTFIILLLPKYHLKKANSDREKFYNEQTYINVLGEKLPSYCKENHFKKLSEKFSNGLFTIQNFNLNEKKKFKRYLSATFYPFKTKFVYYDKADGDTLAKIAYSRLVNPS